MCEVKSVKRKLRDSENSLRTHQAAGKTSRAVHCVWEWPAAESHWPAVIHSFSPAGFGPLLTPIMP